MAQRCYLVAMVWVRDACGFAEYGRGRTHTVELYGGRIVFLGERNNALAGNPDWDLLLVIEWPDRAALQRWWDSPEYAPWKEMLSRVAGAELSVVERVDTLEGEGYPAPKLVIDN